MRTPESRARSSESLKRFWAAHPERAAERGAKLRGENHYRWKGGSSRLNTSIRAMTENRRWMDAVKARDGRCVRCGSVEGLETHHVRSLADLVADLGITCRDDARAQAGALWDISNGETLCAGCHYVEHGRTGPPSQRATRFKVCPECSTSFVVRPSMVERRGCCSVTCREAYKAKKRVGAGNPNWRGGRIEKRCIRCDDPILLKPAEVKKGQGKWCSRECRYAHG
jgi:hypothetical protein